MCSAEKDPENLFGSGMLHHKDEEDNMKLMDDLGIVAVSIEQQHNFPFTCACDGQKLPDYSEKIFIICTF